MASKSNLTYLEGAVRDKVAAILSRSETLAAGTEASDRMADLLRNLSSMLTDYDTQSVDIYNRSL
jgi:hypothetical protein